LNLNQGLEQDLKLDLDFNEDQLAIADAVRRLCENKCDTETVKQLSGQFPTELWQELTAMGILSPATPEGEGMGGTLEICAISEALGQWVFPGPVAASYFATQVLPDEARASVIEGKSIVSLSQVGDTLLPWGLEADLFLILEGKQSYLAEAPSKKEAVETVETLGGEPWARTPSPLKSTQALSNTKRGLTLNSISSAAYLCGAGLTLVKEAAEYTTVRKQFGKTLGEFQAVSHPLADAQINLSAAQQLARAAACCFDQGDFDSATQYASGARLSANRSALNAAYVCHQVFAGIGITLEGPAFHISRRIRQLASQPPGDIFARQQVLAQTGLNP